MSAERAAMLREMMRQPPPPLPPIQYGYDHPSRVTCPVSQLVNYVDHDGRSCWIDPDPWPMILEERKLNTQGTDR